MYFVEDTQQTQSNKMPKSTKPKLVVVNSDGVCCEKCSKLVPEKYYLGLNKKNDELWIECRHNGWYCPNHSPTCNCGDMDCECCNAGYEDPDYSEEEDEEEEKEWEKSCVDKTKSEVEFDSNAMDNALYKDNLDWTFYKPEEGEYSVVYIINRK